MHCVSSSFNCYALLRIINVHDEKYITLNDIIHNLNNYRNNQSISDFLC